MEAYFYFMIEGFAKPFDISIVTLSSSSNGLTFGRSTRTSASSS